MTTARASVWTEFILPAAAPPAAAAEVAALTAALARADEAAWRNFFDLYFFRLFRYLLVVHHGAGGTVHALIVTAHQDLEEGALPGPHALDDLGIRQRRRHGRALRLQQRHA